MASKRSALLFLVFATVAAYSSVLKRDFVSLDDATYVVGNPAVRGGLTFAGIRWALTSTEAGLWHPVTWLSHMLDVELYGLNPSGHHLTSLLLHAANAAVLFLVLRAMTGAHW